MVSRLCPSRSGRPRSRSTRSGCSSRACCSPAIPAGALDTAYPRSFSERTSEERIPGSSSITSTCVTVGTLEQEEGEGRGDGTTPTPGDGARLAVRRGRGRGDHLRGGRPGRPGGRARLGRRDRRPAGVDGAVLDHGGCAVADPERDRGGAPARVQEPSSTPAPSRTIKPRQTAPAPAPTPREDEPSTASFTNDGGTVVASCRGSEISLDSIRPRDGWRFEKEVEHGGLEVVFKAVEREVEMMLVCVRGVPTQGGS